MNKILVGDIGGTKTTLSLYTLSNNNPDCISQQTYISHDFGQFNKILQDFIAKNNAGAINVMVLGVAGPVFDNTCKTTNLPWTISAQDIKTEFSISKVILLNDIEASGLGLLHADERDLVQINPSAVMKKGHRAIISIGTGLGEALLFWDGKQYIPSAAEGGHEDFAPLTEEDIALWQYLHKRHPEHISFERVVSGPGIALIYDYLCQQNNIPNKAPKTNTSAWISTRAMQSIDPLCSQCMDIFIRFLASEATNLVLKVLSVGGIYITGGIAPKIAPLLEQPLFMEYFCNKGRFNSLLSELPVWINKNEEAPLVGALYKAREVLNAGGA